MAHEAPLHLHKKPHTKMLSNLIHRILSLIKSNTAHRRVANLPQLLALTFEVSTKSVTRLRTTKKMTFFSETKIPPPEMVMQYELNVHFVLVDFKLVWDISGLTC